MANLAKIDSATKRGIARITAMAKRTGLSTREAAAKLIGRTRRAGSAVAGASTAIVPSIVAEGLPLGANFTLSAADAEADAMGSPVGASTVATPALLALAALMPRGSAWRRFLLRLVKGGAHALAARLGGRVPKAVRAALAEGPKPAAH